MHFVSLRAVVKSLSTLRPTKTVYALPSSIPEPALLKIIWPMYSNAIGAFPAPPQPSQA